MFATLAFLLMSAATMTAAQDADTKSFTSTMYVRTDSDRTTVYAPRLSLSVPLGPQTRATVAYTVDVWTSASVDIRTSASRMNMGEAQPSPQQEVKEQRDEIDIGLSQAFGELTVRGGYRYSTENDYESHGGSAGATYEFAQKNSSIALDVAGLSDKVGRAGDPQFDKPASTVSARTSFTQVIDTEMLAQLTYELMRQDGFLSSPYRAVFIAAEDKPETIRCDAPIKNCPLEVNPGERTRHAASLQVRRALGSAFSVGARYRFYLDDWDLTSNTVSADVTWRPGDDWLLSLEYRIYQQSAASHYRPFYHEDPDRKYYTSDKELSELTGHRASLEVQRAWPLDDLGSRLKTVLMVAPSMYQYPQFPRLDQIQALEMTASVGVEL